MGNRLCRDILLKWMYGWKLNTGRDVEPHWTEEKCKLKAQRNIIQLSPCYYTIFRLKKLMTPVKLERIESEVLIHIAREKLKCYSYSVNNWAVSCKTTHISTISPSNYNLGHL